MGGGVVTWADEGAAGNLKGVSLVLFFGGVTDVDFVLGDFLFCVLKFVEGNVLGDFVWGLVCEKTHWFCKVLSCVEGDL